MIVKLKEIKKKQENKIKELEKRVDQEEYMVHIHEERLRKVRVAKKLVGCEGIVGNKQIN